MYIRSLFLKLNFKTNTNHDHFNFLFLISQPQHIFVFFTNFSFALIKFVITVTRTRWLTPFVPNTTFLYSLKTVILENRNIFCFQGVEKGCTGNKCVNFLTFFRQDHTINVTTFGQNHCNYRRHAVTFNWELHPYEFKFK